MVKVTVCGAAGGIGQPLSLLLKLNPQVTELSVFDIVNSKGVAADLSHISLPAKVVGYQPSDPKNPETLRQALVGSQLVVIPAGVPRKPGMTRADLFNVNASIVRDIVAQVGHVSPDASILVISNPVNSTVPIAAEVLKKLKVFNPAKLFGVTTLDTVRAETFLGDLIDETPSLIKGRISVIGGHSGDTIVPLLNANPDIASKVSNLPKHKYDEFIRRVQFGGDEVVKAKNGAGSATLSMAQAGYRFASNILDSFLGKSQTSGIPDSAFVYLPGFPRGNAVSHSSLAGVEYFAVPVILENGAIQSYIDPFSDLNVSPEEKRLIGVALSGLEKSIAQGVNFVAGSKL